MKSKGIQLWLNDLGKDPDAVINYLIDDMIIAGMVETPDDMPELPWQVIELQDDSDSFSLVHLKANELSRRGANVSVRKTRPIFMNAVLTLIGLGLVASIIFAAMILSARSQSREMHELEVQESIDARADPHQRFDLL